MKLRVKMWDSNVFEKLFKDFLFLQIEEWRWNLMTYFVVVYGTLSIAFEMEVGRPHSS